ncbi:hypothetical protein CHLNCDRAFT_139158 [Chlorella variabilis]|uniref:Uncharacterized protein n=1 Tax=Chlorella variabilis TaxID=554065 RepID=E1ZPK4_CHLVA|nr:hypothetical protein CHLNCDRAFT_139158 [Chlorella variabilis]EFN52338.1 hypothetical protein CHLNCDRAFT_139158 [Chlorella variabilis]|eukprot:XP_005844440.1 hypothetical protein CHLNCDRAFT_139158 [Chlorella variabilis]
MQAPAPERKPRTLGMLVLGVAAMAGLLLLAVAHSSAGSVGYLSSPSQLVSTLTAASLTGMDENSGVNSPVSDIGSSFYDAAVVSQTDKVTAANASGGHATHHYEYIYQKYLGHLNPRTPLRLLEIGLGYGMPPPHVAGSSLQLWRAYFPNAAISFIELHEGTAEEFREEIEETGGNIFVGSQSDPDVMAQVRLLALATGGFDVIIDDGGHIPADQRRSFEGLWPAVRPGGVYFVEDLLTSYWEEWAKTPKEDSIMAFVKQAIDAMNCHSVEPGPNAQRWKKFCDVEHLGKSFASLDCAPEICAAVKARE